MRFFNERYPFYCGIDLHTKTMYLCVVDSDGQTFLHRNIKCDPKLFLKLLAPYCGQVVALRNDPACVSATNDPISCVLIGHTDTALFKKELFAPGRAGAGGQLPGGKHGALI